MRTRPGVVRIKAILLADSWELCCLVDIELFDLKPTRPIDGSKQT